MIDFELYRIFAVVAEEENVTKAGERLNISQPAITKQIKNLEGQLSMTLFERVKLFERKSKGVCLTDSGRKLYDKIKKPIEELNRIDGQIGKETSINIGTHNHIGGLIFGDAVNEYTLKYPNINVNTVCEEVETLLTKLQNKELDIVFAKKYDENIPEGLKFVKMGEMHEAFIANKNSDWVNKIISFENLENEIIYIPRDYEQTTKRIINLILNKNIKYKLSNYRSIVRMINEGNIIGVVTAEYLYDWEWEKFNLVEVKNDIGLGKVEFGIYLNSKKNSELNKLIYIINDKFDK